MSPYNQYNAVTLSNNRFIYTEIISDYVKKSPTLHAEYGTIKMYFDRKEADFMQGLGTDIVEISRVAKAIEKQRFVTKVFTPKEQEWLAEKTGSRNQSAAGLFCAKEAIVKALGTGFGAEFGFHDIEIGHTPLGAPIVLKPSGKFLLSISHCDEYATATAVYLGREDS